MPAASVYQSGFKMKIREITRFESKVFDSVLKLLPQLGPNHRPLTEKQFRKILKSDNSHFFIAELETNEIAGMLTLGTYYIPTGTKVWIEDVVVDESQRGKGIGQELTIFAVKFAGSLNAESVELTSRPSRIAANKLYQKLGFIKRETNVYRFDLK
jgi:ribosomal protein S18 acetylase RimI-like enzyme